MRKFLTWILLLNMVVLLTACGNKTTAEQSADAAGKQETKAITHCRFTLLFMHR